MLKSAPPTILFSLADKLVKRALQGTVLLGVMGLIACGGHSKNPSTSAPLPALILSAQLGGTNTVDVQSANAFSMPAAAMPLSQKINFSVGNSFFRNAWVIAPASTTARDGLGPIFNTNACQNCHIKDGRGHTPINDQDNAVSMLVRLSVIDQQPTAEDGVVPHPIYGGQLQDFAIPGHSAEAKIAIDYRFHKVTLADGEVVELRQPKLRLHDFSDKPLDGNARSSIRIAPPMIGLGYFEALTEAQILANADPDDRDRNGISGKANFVWDIASNQLTLGRFGWKSEQPSLKQQNAMAFAGDMGLTSTLVKADDCTSVQKQCLTAPNGGDIEVSDNILDSVTFYTANLAVPKARNSETDAFKIGTQLFQSIGCADCHTPQWQIGTVPDMPWLSNQTIYPFTDMLLHDMGPGLSDERPVFLAQGNEWRTPPLWGIGLTSTVNNEFGYLHDGRARSITEAILWHAGEAEASKSKFIQLAKPQRDHLLAFINSL